VRRFILPIIGLALLTSGCMRRPLTLGEAADLMNETSDVLATVKDAKTFEAAKPKLKPRLNRLRESSELQKAQQQANSNRAATKEDMDRAMKELQKAQNDPDWNRFWQAAMKYAGEVMRVSLAVPGAGEWISKESGGTWNSSNK
jgi:hypothetical protein